MRQAWFGEPRSHVAFGMEGIAHPPPSALCRCISFNATALSPHFTELDADSGLTHSVPGPEGGHGPPPPRPDHSQDRGWLPVLQGEKGEGWD